MANIYFKNWSAIELLSVNSSVEQSFTTFESLFSDSDSVTYYSLTNTKLMGYYFGTNATYDLVVTGNHFTDASSVVNFNKFSYSNSNTLINISSNLSVNAFSGYTSGYISRVTYTSNLAESFDIKGRFNVQPNGNLAGGRYTSIELIADENTVNLTGNITFNARGNITGGTISSFSIIDNLGNEFQASGLAISYSAFESLTDPIYGNTDLSNFYSFITRGNDTIFGSTDVDDLVGGKGNDTYIVDNAGDTVTELINEGLDTVKASISYNLGDNVENLTLTDGLDIDGTGNALRNTIRGNAGNNTLDGGDNADKLYGDLGDDRYIVDLAQTGTKDSNYRVKLEDVVVEGRNAGVDTLELRGSFNHLNATTISLNTHLENLDASNTGTTKLDLTGNASNNIITGNAADNIINASSGDDTLIGGAGNDTLNGGTGIDSLIGGIGDDTYIVDLVYTGTSPNFSASLQDTITELSDEGTDTLKLRGNLTKLKIPTEIALAGDLSNIENLDITGTTTTKLNITGNDVANILTGNNTANILTGNGGNDILDGKKGADTMVGGTGDDSYYVDNKGDVITEQVGEGNDTVNTTISYDLSVNGDNVENITLLGNAALKATGNDLDNTIIGNNANNILDGGSGADTLKGEAGNDRLNGGADNDTLIGGLGNDIMTGGIGADIFKWELADNGTNRRASIDKITDFDVAEGDVLDLRDLLVAESIGADNLLNYLDITTSTKSGITNTEIRISTDGSFANGEFSASNENAHITLIGTDLFLDTGSSTEAELIQNLITNNKLIVDG